MQFERFFDPAATLYAPSITSTRTSTTPAASPSKRRGGGPARSAAPVFASASPRTLSRTTAKAMLLRQQAAFNSPQQAEPLLLAGRASSSAPRATRPPPVPGSPAAASASSAAGLRLSGMLDHQRVPPDARRRLDQLRLEAAAWSEAQVRHQCERGVIVRVAALLRIPALQDGACGLLADLGGRWPAALAGAAGDVARELPLPLARIRSRGEALCLLRTLAACGEAGCTAVTGSLPLMGELTEMLLCRPATPGPGPAAAGAESTTAEQRQPGEPDAKPGGRRGEVWGPGLMPIGLGVSSPSRVMSPSSQSLLPVRGTPSQASAAAALSEAAVAATVLLSLLSSPASAAEVCWLHSTAVDPVCCLFRRIAAEHVTEQEESVLKLLLGKHVGCSAILGDVNFRSEYCYSLSVTEGSVQRAFSCGEVPSELSCNCMLPPSFLSAQIVWPSSPRSCLQGNAWSAPRPTRSSHCCCSSFAAAATSPLPRVAWLCAHSRVWAESQGVPMASAEVR